MKSLKSRLITIFTVLILSLTVIFAFVSISIVSKNLTKNTHGDLKDMAQAHAKYVESRRNEELKYVDALAQNEVIQNEKVLLEKKNRICSFCLCR